MSFVHLHTHTEYSLLDGSNKIVEYVAKVKDMGMTAAAITDHGVMYGVIDFYRECKKAGINPVLGCEVYVAPGSRFERELSHGEDRYYHLILLAENDLGYANLMKIVSIGFVDGYYYKPRVDFETLEKYHEGIICLSACLAGEVARLLERGLYEDAKAVALKYEACFGKGNYFLEMQDHGIPAQRTVNQGLLRMSQETGIELVCTNDCHYTNAEDADAHDLLLCIQTGKKVQDEDRMRYEGGQYYVKSEEEMRSLFSYAPQALENTQKIADRCHVEIEFGNTKLPHFEVPEGYDSWTYLNKLCHDGLERRYAASKTPEELEKIRTQLDYELGVIKRMGYVDYFLIVWDFINYARMNGIPVGPGRGSAAGSLVSYTTGITDIDPIRYSLLFERFLNPERVSMPDIDVDICYERRGEVIDYVVDKYGKDCVTQIVTFGTMKAKNAIRDVGRVLDLPYTYVDSVAKQIPNVLNITIADALKLNPELKTMYDTDETVKSLIDYAMRLEGLPRNTSMHAAGVVIASKPMDEFVPVAKGADGTIVTQFTMVTIEELGLLKMDFLGLRTLTVINDAVKMIRANTGRDIDFRNMECDDPKVFELISSGRCEGIFQLESGGMKGFMKELHPESLEDVIAGISLYRPGPMDFIPNYIRGKNDKASIRYETPELEPILKATYGCIVYQEQVMQIFQNLAGYSMGQADNIRRAMSKKKQYVIDAERANFVDGNAEENIPGCVGNGIDRDAANRIYDSMVDFAKYAFNKSHAACYAVVAYQTAYLKLYYPKEFMAALMTSVIDSASGKIANYIQVCRDMNIPVLPPDINAGEGVFSVDGDGIRYGMYAIKSVGRPVIDHIVEERKAHGPYKNLEEFINRVNGREVNKRSLENLIKAGAMDCLEGNRRQKVYVFPMILDSVNESKKKNMEGQVSLFDLVPEETKSSFEIQFPDQPEFDKEVKLAFEKEVLGIYVSGHPLEDYLDVMGRICTAKSTDFLLQEPEEGNMTGEDATTIVKDKQKVTVGGMIVDVRTIFTKKNQMMAYVTIEDLYGTMEVIVFPRDFERNRRVLVEDSKVFISGRVDAQEEKDAKLLCESVTPFEEISKTLWIQFETKEDYESMEQGLFDAIAGNEGRDHIKIYVKNPKAIKELPSKYNICADTETVQKLSEKFGADNVKVVS
ncbi:MAG: DNA polymerase III subunit alpha [Lachnospiraceae bacterium]|nr:DNA polymerase III subunit alpha [Lachnospiraceae bacterium]MBQ2577808.1 DNA polymerase III subunit alpha [Lachnospiraceae bacterium]